MPEKASRCEKQRTEIIGVNSRWRFGLRRLRHLARPEGWPPGTFLACPLLYTLVKKEREDGEMKYYMASYSGTVSDGMTYKAQGSGSDLYRHFPELREVINRYPFKSIDFRLANGDRLRIYDINKNMSLNN